MRLKALLLENKKALQRSEEFANSCHSLCGAVARRFLPPGAGLPACLIPCQAMGLDCPCVALVVTLQP
jgi:hypothetical protein